MAKNNQSNLCVFDGTILAYALRYTLPRRTSAAVDVRAAIKMNILNIDKPVARRMLDDMSEVEDLDSGWGEIQEILRQRIKGR